MPSPTIGESLAKKEKGWDFFSTGFRHEYSARHLFGTDGVDFQERVNFQRLREYRLGRLRWAMKKFNLSALLVNIGDNIRYATGTWDYAWKGNNNSRYALVFHDDNWPILFDTVGLDSHVTQLYCPWMEGRLRPAITYRYTADGFQPICRRYWEQIQSECREGGVDVVKDPVGVDFVDPGALVIAQEMNLKVVPAGQAINEARYIKNRDELEMLKVAAAIGDMAYWKAKYEFAKPGVREREVLGKVVDFLYQCGVQHAWGTNVASGGNTNPYIRAFTDKLIRQGDMIILDLNSNHYYGYIQDLCRSWVVADEMTSKQKEVYKVCYDLLQRSLEKIKAGSSTADIAGAWPEYYDDKYKTCSLVQFAHTIGQGLYEGFWVSRGFSLDYPQELQENMYLAVETWAGDPGEEFSVRLENNLVVTRDGYIVFDLFPFEQEALG